MAKSYITIIRDFHKLRRKVRITSYAADLYFLLVEECNLGHWENPFTMETKTVEKILGITRPTICKARKELVALGLVKIEEGKNGNSVSKYTLCSVNVVNTECKGDLHYKESKNQSSVNDVNSSVNVVNTDTLYIYKDIKTTLSNDKVPPAVADGVKKSEKKKGGSEKKKEGVTKRDTRGSGGVTPKPKTKPKPEKKVTATPETNPKGKEGAGEENSEKPKNPKSRQKSSIVTKAKEIFEEYYLAEFGSAYYWEAKDAVGMKKLLQKISYSREHREIPLPVDEDSLLDALRQFLQAIDKAWIRNNFSVPKISSFYNDIVSEIKNKKKNTNETSSTTALATRGNTTGTLADTERKSSNIIAEFAQAGTEWEAKKRDLQSREIIDVEPLPD